MGSSRKITINKDNTRVLDIRDRPPITNIVFEGGGPKGVVYVGAVKALEAQGVLKNIKNVAGSSAGAMTAVFIGLGCSADQFDSMSKAINLGELLDPPEISGQATYTERMAKGIVNLAKTSIAGKGPEDRYMFTGEKLLDKIREVVATLVKTAIAKYPDINDLGIKPDHITFKDIQRISEKHPDLHFKDIVITGSNLTEKKLEFFSADTTPDMEIAMATRISMSLPVFFKPVTYNDKVYVDGGALNNFPMDIFDKEPYLSRNGNQGHLHLGEQKQNLQTIGLRVDDEKEMQEILWKARANPEARTSLSMLDKVVGLKVDDAARAIDKATYDKYSLQTIQISDLGHKTTDFDVNEEKRAKMIAEGKSAASAYLDYNIGSSIYDKYASFSDMIEHQTDAALVQLCKDLADPTTEFTLENHTDAESVTIRSACLTIAKNTLQARESNVKDMLKETEEKVKIAGASKDKAESHRADIPSEDKNWQDLEKSIEAVNRTYERVRYMDREMQAGRSVKEDYIQTWGTLEELKQLLSEQLTTLENVTHTVEATRKKQDINDGKSLFAATKPLSNAIQIDSSPRAEMNFSVSSPTPDLLQQAPLPSTSVRVR